MSNKLKDKLLYMPYTFGCGLTDLDPCPGTVPSHCWPLLSVLLNTL